MKRGKTKKPFPPTDVPDWIVCPDCGPVIVESDVFGRDALGQKIGISGECPECGDRLYFEPPDGEDE